MNKNTHSFAHTRVELPRNKCIHTYKHILTHTNTRTDTLTQSHIEISLRDKEPTYLYVYGLRFKILYIDNSIHT